MTQETPTLLFNPFDPAFRIDPYPTYARIRAESPIHQGAFDNWVLSRYADCVAMLKDPQSSSDSRNSAAYMEFIKQSGGAAEELMESGRPFLFMDPPDHTRLRGLVSKAFTPRVVEGLRPRIQEIVDALIDAAAPKGTIEIVEDFAYPTPVRVICEMLGVPPEDHETFKGWSRELARSLDPEEFLPPDVIERRQRALDEFREYFRGLIAQRKAEPREDLLSGLIAVEERGDTLDEDELLSICTLLLVAGHETTVNLIANGVLALLRNPDQLDLLRSDPSLTRSAVEEVLRYDPPVQMTARVALKDVETGGETIRAGQQAIILIGSANRDAAQFPDPDRLDITREDNRHLAFGHGIHFCLGAPLARIEGEVALGTLVQRLDGLKLLTETPEYKENVVLRGLAALPVGFSKAR